MDYRAAQSYTAVYSISFTVAGIPEVRGHIAELTKQGGGRGGGALTQEIRGVKPRLKSVDSRLAMVEAWERRFIKIEGRLDSVDSVKQQHGSGQDLPRGGGHHLRGVGVLLAVEEDAIAERVQGRHR